MKKKAKFKILYVSSYTIMLFLGGIVLFSCTNEKKVESEILKIPMSLKVLRFNNDLKNATPENFIDVKQKFPYLFPKQVPDSVWIAKLDDTLQIALLNEADKAFGDFEKQREDLNLLFKHIKYYFPKINGPKVVTMTSNVDYQNRIILTDSLLLIGLDNYLGPKHRFYVGMQRFLANQFDKQFLTSDVASAFATKILNYPKERTFLAKIIYYGKILYIKDKLLPLNSDAQKIGYSEDQFNWVVANEEEIWRYFIKNELLYNTDNKLEARFIDLGPFSKFGLELDMDSPSMVGRYIGWQIVRDYMEKNDLSLQQLLHTPATEIFTNAKYKPKK